MHCMFHSKGSALESSHDYTQEKHLCRHEKIKVSESYQSKVNITTNFLTNILIMNFTQSLPFSIVKDNDQIIYYYILYMLYIYKMPYYLFHNIFDNNQMLFAKTTILMVFCDLLCHKWSKPKWILTHSVTCSNMHNLKFRDPGTKSSQK